MFTCPTGRWSRAPALARAYAGVLSCVPAAGPARRPNLSSTRLVRCGLSLEGVMMLRRAWFAPVILSVVALSAAPTSARQSARDGDLYTMALTGDAIITRRLSVYREPEFVRM